MFFKTLSCEAAEWTLNEVYEFVSESEMFNNSDDEDGERDRNKVGFKMGFATLATAVRDNVGWLTGALDAVLRSPDDRSQYADMSTLETLFALQMDVHFLSANLASMRDDAYRVLAADMTAAQKYLTGHCANAPPAADVRLLVPTSQRDRCLVGVLVRGPGGVIAA